MRSLVDSDTEKTTESRSGNSEACIGCMRHANHRRAIYVTAGLGTVVCVVTYVIVISDGGTLARHTPLRPWHVQGSDQHTRLNCTLRQRNLNTSASWPNGGSIPDGFRGEVSTPAHPRAITGDAGTCTVANVLENVMASTRHVYGLRDSRGVGMDCARVMYAPWAGVSRYIAVYHARSRVTKQFEVHVAQSFDLIR